MELTINVKIGKRNVPLTLKAARELHQALGEMLGVTKPIQRNVDEVSSPDGSKSEF